jgi:hypothetical protein
LETYVFRLQGGPEFPMKRGACFAGNGRWILPTGKSGDLHCHGAAIKLAAIRVETSPLWAFMRLEEPTGETLHALMALAIHVD